ncbi:hypothetical protein [Streptomyces sp. NBC_00631]|uniref:hypothetical protein n=1 Tax=Streptomyces sp. NBC_00631 TaxID=2975793 RepID=UPI00386E63EB
MRRTVRALSVAVLAGAACGATGTAVAAADPAAEVSPGSARPGATVIVSVTCEKAGGHEPVAIDATSSAFAGHTVRLARVEQSGGLTYRGTARVVSGDTPLTYTERDAAGSGPDGTWTVGGTCPAASGQQGRPWSTHLALARGDGAGTASAGVGGTLVQGGDGAMPQVGGGALPPGDGGAAAPHGDDGAAVGGGDDATAPRGDDGTFGRGDEGTAPHGDVGTTDRGDENIAGRGDGDIAGRGDEGMVSPGDEGAASRGPRGDGDAADPRGEDGAVPRGDGERPCAGAQQSCDGGDGRECQGTRGGDGGLCAAAGVQHGVAAGDGGAYSTSVPALVAGGMLIVAACCGAAYRLWGGRLWGGRLWGGRAGADG